MNQKAMITTAEAAVILHLCSETVLRYAHSGKLHATRSGRKLLFDKVEVESLLEPVGVPAAMGTSLPPAQHQASDAAIEALLKGAQS